MGLDDSFVGGELRGHADELEGLEASGSGVHHVAVGRARVDLGDVGALGECDQVLGVGSGTETEYAGLSDGTKEGTVLNPSFGVCADQGSSQAPALSHACQTNLAGVSQFGHQGEFAPKSSEAESCVEQAGDAADEPASRERGGAGGREGRWVLRRQVEVGGDDGMTMEARANG